MKGSRVVLVARRYEPALREHELPEPSYAIST